MAGMLTPVLHLVTCGSVDDGKSTLIGRLLAETNSVPIDTLEYARRTRRGGSTIPVQVARVLIGVIDFDLPLGQAMALPVLFSPGEAITVEQGSALEAMIPALRALGHAQVSARGLPLKINGAERTAGGWVGAADPRSEGAAVGE